MIKSNTRQNAKHVLIFFLNTICKRHNVLLNLLRNNIIIPHYRIEYEPKSVGWYTANILFADQEIPTSPYKVNVEPNIDVSKIKVNGLEPSKCIYISMSVQYIHRVMNKNIFMNLCFRLE